MTHTVKLVSPFARRRACELVMKAPDGFVASVAEPRRTLDQNAKMHAMLSDISIAKPMGRRQTPEEWKWLLMQACGYDCTFMEGLDGRPFPVGFRSSRLTKSQMSALIEYMLAFGAEHNVRWADEQEEAA